LDDEGDIPDDVYQAHSEGGCDEKDEQENRSPALDIGVAIN